jgi:DNA gyrase subunit A
MSENIKQQEVSQVIKEKMMPYSLSVLISRALPELVDGFKPSQRKFLYTMHTMKLHNQRAKSANISGQVMKINPHADSYLTGVRLTKEAESILCPMIHGKGSFGKHYSTDTQPSAARYTEMQLAPICHELFDSLKKNPSNMIDNFDGTMKEPRYVSAPFPNILANPNMGIAVGFACNFPSFNLIELCDAAIEIVKNYNMDNSKLLSLIMKSMPTADFTTGGEILINKEQMKSIYESGQGAITIRSVFTNNEKERILEVDEIPYSTSLENIIDAIIKAYKENRIPEITGVRDETDKNGLKIAIDYKRGTDVEALKKKLLALTPLQDNFNVNMNLVYQNTPQSMGVIDILKNWVAHRREWIETELSYDLNEKQNQLHLLEGLEKVLLDIEKAVSIVRQSKDDAEVIQGLKKAFGLDDVQAEFVAEIKLRNFNEDYILNKTKEINGLKSDITTLQETIACGIDNKIIDDLQRIKSKYGIPRKSKIITDYEELPTFRKNAKPEVNTDGNSIIFCNNETVKRVSTTSSAKTPNGFVKWEVENKGELLIFTSLGKTFKYPIAKIPEGANQKISDIKQIAKKLEVGETILYSCPLIPDHLLVILFDNHKLVKFKLSAYITESNKLCFTKGFNTNSPVEYMRAIPQDKVIELEKYQEPIDTAQYKESSSRTAQGIKLKSK